MTEHTTENCQFCGRPVGKVSVETADNSYCSSGCRNAEEALDETADTLAASEPSASDVTDSNSVFFHVAGMHCVTCETFLENIARDQQGVSDASASYVSESIRLSYNSDETDPETLADMLSVAGYRVADREQTGQESVTTELSREGGAATRDLEDLLGYRYAAGVLFGLFLMFPYAIVFYPYQLSGLLGWSLQGFEGGTVESGLILLFPLFASVTSVVVFFTSLPLLRGAYVSLRTRQPNTDLLGALMLLTAYVYSIVALLLGRLDMYFDLTIFVGASVVAASFYESVTKQRAMDHLTDLTLSQTETATLYREGDTEPVAVETLSPTDQILVGQGERVPVDGTLVEGPCTVDESVVTGESLPVVKEAGDRLVGGSIVTDGGAVISVADPPTSSIDRLTTAVWHLQSVTHGLQRGADRLAARVLPVLASVAVMAVAVAVALGHGAKTAVLWSLLVVLVGCPWGLALSTPLSVAANIQEAIGRGIVVFDETVFERIRETDVVVFDKTGTLTRGRMTVTSADAPTEDLAAVAELERRAAHPAADAITDAFGTAQTDGGTQETPTDSSAKTLTVTDFETHGLGVSGTIDSDEYLVGHPDLFRERGWTLPPSTKAQVVSAQDDGALPVVVGRDGEARGVIVLTDEPREGWAEMLSRLSERDIEVIVLTGDDETATRFFRSHSDVTRVFAGIPPEGKTETVRRLQDGQTATMVGDGTNDAPALAQADLGISLGSGTALASDAADVAIADDDLAGVETTFDLASVAGKRVKQNTALGLLYNVLVIPAALFGVLTPVIAMAAAVLSGSLLAVNAHRTVLQE
ncbi:heavy metal translocating P-type ATPase [Halovenus rubra]|uniref:Heavy metal translocating P-type ATPase n=2 Tax=Halovenus rubra TaxID=869890 RepID=A0ACC7E4J3_9EURY|nr:cation-translocating P-type ATPase [Halovenus rubra]